MSKTNEAGGASSRKKWLRYCYIVLAVIIVSSGLNWVDNVRIQQQGEVTQMNSVVQAETTLRSQVCKDEPERPLCVVAKQVIEDPNAPLPGVPGPRGREGKPGVDGIDGSIITGMNCASGKLTLTYTDNGIAEEVSTKVVCTLPETPTSKK